MRIGLNLLHALPEIGGGWNYIRGLVRGLAEIDSSDHFVVFLTRESEMLVPERPNFELVRIPLDSANRPRRVLFEHTTLPRLVRRHRLDCLHWFSSTQALIRSVPGVVTIYDLHPFLNLSPYSVTKKAYLKTMITQTVRRAHHLLPMSRATADALIQLFHLNPRRLSVIPPVLGKDFRPATEEEISSFRSKHRLPEKFWLYVGDFLPHKNHLRLLEAYHRWISNIPSAWPLLFRGDDKGTEKQIRHFIEQRDLQRNVAILPRLGNSEIRILYSAATALVFPSLYEGGGLPVVEAMACGLPVAAAGIPPVREFAGRAALYFNPNDAGSILNAMKELQTRLELRESLRTAGLWRAEEFRPPKVIPRLLEAYAGAAAKRKNRTIEIRVRPGNRPGR